MTAKVYSGMLSIIATFIVLWLGGCSGSSRKPDSILVTAKPGPATPAFFDSAIHSLRKVASEEGCYVYSGYDGKNIISHLPYATQITVTNSWVERETDSVHFYFVELQDVIKGWVRADKISDKSLPPLEKTAVTLTPEFFHGGWLMPVKEQVHRVDFTYRYCVFDRDSTFKTYVLGRKLPLSVGKWSVIDSMLALNEGYSIGDHSLPAPKPLFSATSAGFVVDGEYNLLNLFKVDDRYWAGKTRYTTEMTPLKNLPEPEGETIRKIPSGTSVNFFSAENGWARVIHKSDTGYVAAGVLAFETEENGFIDAELLPGRWTAPYGEGLVLNLDRSWYYDGPDAEGMSGTWKYNHADHFLELLYDSDGATLNYQVYSLSHEKMRMDWDNQKTEFLKLD